MRIDEMIDALIEAHPHTNSDFGSYVVERSRSGFHHTWSSRIEVLRRGFRVSPASETVSQKFDQLVDVRNAIAHGDGHLTTLQTSRTAAGIDLRRNIEKTFGIVVAGRKLHLNPMAGMIGTRVARDYLLAVDVEYSKALLQIGR
ncbi:MULTISPECIES: hypothetical protein [unclassified Microbacterium]|uniref:hypothetical protein n=1 Tax=unclassified Microbacterium TaxID=2609290 RepID=UPI00049389C2|nr:MULTISPECIES: hypothetical protein [unclassified Microbacterium]